MIVFFSIMQSRLFNLSNNVFGGKQEVEIRATNSQINTHKFQPVVTHFV